MPYPKMFESGDWKMLSVKLPVKVCKEFEEIASQRGLMRTDLARSVIEQYVKEEKKNENKSA